MDELSRVVRWRDVGAVQHIDRERIGGLHIHGWMPKRLASSVYGVYALMFKVCFSSRFSVEDDSHMWGDVDGEEVESDE